MRHHLQSFLPAAVAMFIIHSAMAARASGSDNLVETSSAAQVLFFDLDAAVATESLDYHEQLLAFVFEGLVNKAGAQSPTIQFNAAFMNFDWPGSDLHWREYFSTTGRVQYHNVTDATLCGLVTGGDPNKQISGAVVYNPLLAGGDAETWALPIAVTLAAQQSLLPMTAAMRLRHPCLAALPVIKDLGVEPWAANETAAWEWAFETLLPGASTTVAYNLYHYEPQIHTDPQSNATLANVDYAVQQKAFIMNFRTTGNPASQVNPLFSQALAGMEPLFSVFGWTDDEFGFVWTPRPFRTNRRSNRMATSSGAAPDGTRNASARGGGGAVFCSFATPNLSFWKLLTIPGRSTARALPVFDRGMKLDRTKSYVLIETNEGDTPRIVVSAFSKSWTDPRRGSLPVSWAIDPALGEQFPALFDYFASTAGVNDSFISGPGGCGYVYYGRMTDLQIQTFATRCGRLMKDYGPAVIDTYGQTGSSQLNTRSVLANFSLYAAESGTAPEMYISQPTGVIKYAYYDCQDTLNQYLPDGTPIVCTKSGIFYIPGALGHTPCPSCTLSDRINAVAATRTTHPLFITVYGGLKWTADTADPATEFWTLWGATIDKLDTDIIAVGAQEMARLAKEARVL